MSMNADMEFILNKDENFRCQMLDRFRHDCEYYLGNGNRVASRLWSLDEKEHIQNMRTLYASFSDGDKPEWLTMEQILEYEKQMTS